eukprot:CAMPEP_0179412056 /NCGR_PEP_ID=MMETSP0799-20121207/4244_1 /TAXON_ID=46947 /ORGANISM="Geminigera cryophila, Strain CCMP2564" /LENGTH=92 /DNA_ID=CAMNT_0021184201 /DNA_START=191 /DNA_END=469 /DNA_ORIENTATION=+
MAADPAPLTDNDRYRLSWEAATERFYDSEDQEKRTRNYLMSYLEESMVALQNGRFFLGGFPRQNLVRRKREWNGSLDADRISKDGFCSVRPS